MTFSAHLFIQTNAIPMGPFYMYIRDSWRRSQNDVVVREVPSVARLWSSAHKMCNRGRYFPYVRVRNLIPGNFLLYMGVYVNPQLLETESESVACVQLWGSTLGGIAFGIMCWCCRAIYSPFLCLVPYPWISQYFVLVSRFLYSCIYAIADMKKAQHVSHWMKLYHPQGVGDWLLPPLLISYLAKFRTELLSYFLLQKSKPPDSVRSGPQASLAWSASSCHRSGLKVSNWAIPNFLWIILNNSQFLQ